MVYLGTFIALAFYLISVIYQWEFFFFFSLLFILVVAIVLIRFDVALLLIPLAIANPYVLEETGTKLNISELLFLIIFVVWACRILLLKEQIVFPKKLLGIVSVIIVTAILSLLVAHDIGTGIKQIIRYFEILLLFLALVINNFKSEKRIKQVFLFLIIGGLIASCVGLAQFINNIFELKRSARVFGWGSGYAAVVASTLFLSISALAYKKERTIRIFALITIPAAGLALLVSQTRAWIGALLIVFGLIFLLKKRKNRSKIVFVTGFILILITVVVLTDVFGLIESKYILEAIGGASRFGETRNVHSLSDASLLMRFVSWEKAMVLYINNPILGVGVGNFRIDYSTLKLGASKEGMGFVDNQYIQGFTETGTLGGIAWILFIIYAVKVGIRSVKNSVGTELYAPAIGFYGSLLMIVVGSFFWVITPVHDLFCLMVLYIGLLINISDHNSYRESIET
jgi:O-antigen ligase